MAGDNSFGHLLPGARPAPTPTQATPDTHPAFIRGTPNPYRQNAEIRANNAEARANTDQALQAAAAARAAAADARSAEAADRARREWEATHYPDGTLKPVQKIRPVSDGRAKEVNGQVKGYDALERSLRTFNDNFGGNLFGGLENTAQGFASGIGTEGQRAWWADFQNTDNMIRNELFGATLTPAELEAFNRTTIKPQMDPKEIRRNLEQRRDIVRDILERQRKFDLANGLDPDAVEALYEPLTRQQTQRNVDAQGNIGNAPPPPAIADAPLPSNPDPRDRGNVPGAGGGPQGGLVQGGTKTEVDPTMAGIAGEYKSRLARGDSGDELVSWLQGMGITDGKILNSAKAQARYRRDWPNVPIDNYPIIISKEVPLSGIEQLRNEAGQSAVGTFAINAGDVLSGNTLDNIAGLTGGNAERTRLAMAENNANSPVAATLGQVAGGTIGALGAEAGLARMGIQNGLARTAGANAMLGAFNGFGGSDVDSQGNAAGIGNRLIGAAGGATVNALAGLAGTGAVKAIQWAGRPTASVINRALGRDENVAVNQVGRALREDGLTPRGAAERIAAANERGVPMAIADTGENSRELLASVARQRGEARSLTKEVIGNRQAGQLERLSSAVRRDLGPTANIRDLGDELMMRAKDESAPLYQEAFRAPGADAVYPKIRTLLARPSMQKAMGRARRIAAEEGRNPDELGLVMDDAGKVSFFEYPQNLADNLEKARSNLLAAQRSATGSMMGTNSKAIAAAEEAVRSAEAALAKAPRGPITTRTPSWETLHYIKTGLDDVIESYRDKTTGKLVLDAEGRLINNTKNQLLKMIDDANPAYKEARALYAGPASMKDAMNLGYGALNRSPDDVAANIKNLGASEMEMYRLGLRKAIIDKMEGKGDYADKVKLMNNTPKTRAVLSKVLGGKAEFDRFMATLADEAELARTYAAVNGNSATAGRQAFDATTQDETIAGGLIDIGRTYATQGKLGVLDRVGSQVAEMARLGTGEAGNRARAQIAELLSTSDPEQLMEIAKQAQRAAAKARLSNRKANVRAVRSGTVGSAIGALGGPETEADR